MHICTVGENFLFLNIKFLLKLSYNLQKSKEEPVISRSGIYLFEFIYFLSVLLIYSVHFCNGAVLSTAAC